VEWHTGSYLIGLVLGTLFGWIYWGRNRKSKESTPSASYNSASHAISEQYNELLMGVCRKYPGESRHDTALRYIRQAESNSYCGSAPKQQA